MNEPAKPLSEGPSSSAGLPPGFVWSILGLAFGVLIGLGIYYYRKGQSEADPDQPPTAAALSAPNSPSAETNPVVTVAMSAQAHPETLTWNFVPKSLCVCDGTTFLVQGAIRTGGLAAAGERKRMPGAVLNIPVYRQGSRIHLLQAAEYGWQVPAGAPYARFVCHYADGKTHSFYLNWGIHGWDWFRGRNERDKAVRDENTRIGWTQQRADGMHIRMYHTIVENPFPDVLMTSFDVISPLSRANLLLFGFTVDNDPRPLAAAVDSSELSMSAHLPQSITFALQDAAGKPLPDAKLSWIAVANRGRIDFPPYKADALGQVKIEVPRGSLSQIIYSASGPEGRQAAGILQPDESGLFPDKQTVALTTEAAAGQKEPTSPEQTIKAVDQTRPR